LKALFLFFLLCLASACTSIHAPEKPIDLDQHSQYYLQAVPQELWGHTSLQKLRISSPEGKHELLLQTELGAKKINMVGLTPAGLVLFKLSWEVGGALTANTNVLAKGLNAQVMLAYYQLANWPLAAVQTGLVDLRATVMATDKQTRHFYRDDELVFSLVHCQNRSLMTHYLDHYQIEIETLQTSTLKD
jgi:hypothetical protein